MNDDWIVSRSEKILITGTNGFIGSKVFVRLLEYGFTDIRCFVRSSRNLPKLKQITDAFPASVEFYQGNLFAHDDCINATRDVAIIYHLAIGPSGKSFPNAFMNAVIPTRNLLEACIGNASLKRFVNISSFAVYSNQNNPHWRLLDEQCPLDEHHALNGDAYGFAKLKQDEIVMDYANKYGFKYVILRPGAVYGPEDNKITGRVGIDTFGIFIHLGGSNKIPFTYVDNCAEAIVLAGLKEGVDGEVFNIVDDDLLSSRQFLRIYKKNVKSFKSIYLPHSLSYLFCYMWEKYSRKSEEQLPPVFNRSRWHNNWKKTRYSNKKLKTLLGWKMKVTTEEGIRRYCESCRERVTND